MRISRLSKAITEERLVGHIEEALGVANAYVGERNVKIHELRVHKRTDGSVSHATFTLRAIRSDGPGARRAPSGRRTCGANWEVHRVFLEALFAALPGSVVRTALTTYYGREGFEATHRATRLNSATSGCTYRQERRGRLGEWQYWIAPRYDMIEGCRLLKKDESEEAST